MRKNKNPRVAALGFFIRFGKVDESLGRLPIAIIYPTICKYLKLCRKRKLYIDISKYNFYNNEDVKTIANSNSND